MWPEWVLDATPMGRPEEGETFCFCPIHNGRVIFGMNYIGEKPPDGAKLVAVIHEDGQEATERWVAEHEELLRRLQEDG